MATARLAKSLPDLLVAQGVLTAEQLRDAQAHATKTGLPLKRAVVQQGFLTEEGLVNLVAEQLGLITLDLSNYVIRPEVIQQVPEALARKHALIPVFKIGSSLTVAIDDPLNFVALDEVRLKAKCEIKTVVAMESAIRQAIDQYYGATGTTAQVAAVIQEAATPKSEQDAAEDAPVIRLVDLLIMQAVKERASDIHIEPGTGTLRTRFRVDGVLHEVHGPPAALHAPVVSRIKVLAKLDIAEKRKSQDGRFRLTMEGREIDLRVSTIPTECGEKVALRLLEGTSASLSLKALGLDDVTGEQVERLIHAPHGIFLVTGPTGSGKTTTLYAALGGINDVSRNIITIEDPVEYHVRGVSQVQVNLKADVTFASALRSFLRQDPDVMLVGEVRDRETAETAVQAALTGHLVFSTLHTNDAASSLTRLIDMGVEPFLIASSVVGVLAQRLVRVLCQRCRQPYQPPAEVVQKFQLGTAGQMFRSAGCPACREVGYKGRIGIFELLVMSEPIRELVMTKAGAHTVRDTARRAGLRTLREDGLAKVATGVTTLEEVLRVTEEH